MILSGHGNQRTVGEVCPQARCWEMSADEIAESWAIISAVLLSLIRSLSVSDESDLSGSEESSLADLSNTWGW